MTTPPTHPSLVAALAAAQGELTNPPKTRTVTVTPREGRPYSFQYAELAGILDMVRPVLSRHGIALIQLPALVRDGAAVAVETRLLHGDQILASVLEALIESPKPQAVGSAITYLRRYALVAMLGLAADDDDDGNAAQGQSAAVAPRTRAQSPPPAPPHSPEPPPVLESGAAERGLRDEYRRCGVKTVADADLLTRWLTRDGDEVPVFGSLKEAIAAGEATGILRALHEATERELGVPPIDTARAWARPEPE